jgi:hypothetical protein
VVAGDKKIEDFRNTFANLALPLFAMAEPVPPKAFEYQGLKWSLWDRCEVPLGPHQVRLGYVKILLVEIFVWVPYYPSV